MWNPISSGTLATALEIGLGSRPSRSASSFFRIAKRIASPPTQWKGSGGSRWFSASTKARRVGVVAAVEGE